MLYFEVNTVGRLDAVMQNSESYSLYGLEAILAYFTELSADHDMSVGDILGYTMYEYPSARAALSDLSPEGLQKALDVAAWWEQETDEEVESFCLEELRQICDHVAPLANGSVLTINA